MKDTYLRLIISLFCIVLINAKQDTIIFSSQDLVINNTIVHHEILGVYASDYSASIVNLNGVVYVSSERRCKDSFDGAGDMIVIVNDACSEINTIKHALESGAIGVGFVDRLTVGRMYNYLIPGLEKGVLPIFYLSIDDYDRYNRNMETGTTNLTLIVLENEYAEFYACTLFLMIQICFLVVFSVMTIYVFWKLVLAVKTYHLCSSVALSLMLELFAFINRLLFWIDPIGSAGLYSIGTSTLLFFLSFIPSFVAHLLLSLYWLDTLKALKSSMFLSRCSTISLIIFAIASFSTGFLLVGFFRVSNTLYIFYCIMTIWLILVIIFKIYAIFKLMDFKNHLEDKDLAIIKINQTIIWYIGATFFAFTFVLQSPFIFIFTSAYSIYLYHVLEMISLIGMSISEIYPLKVSGRDSRARTNITLYLETESSTYKSSTTSSNPYSEDIDTDTSSSISNQL